MRTPIRPLHPPMAASQRDLPRLWPALAAHQQQQLAQLLAELLQRHPLAQPPMPPSETDDELL